MSPYTSKVYNSRNVREEAVLDLVGTGEMIQKEADRFFSDYGLTRAQFNILVLVREAGEQGLDGLIQAEIGREMIVTAANISNHMDRLERAGLIVRTPRDRRTNLVNLTDKARELLARIDEPYFARIEEVMGVLTQKESETLSRLLGKLGKSLRERNG